MVAIVTGSGMGLERSSAWVLGSMGQLGSAAMGRSGENVYVNAANGNLVITRQDEMLIGRGEDAVANRTYNSLGNFNDRDNGDNWFGGLSRRVDNLVGTYGTSGSTVTRYDWDGSFSVYSWDAGRSAYVSTDGAGAYDTLTCQANRWWTWTDGSTQVKEVYDGQYYGLIWQRIDTNNNVQSYSRDNGRVFRVQNSDGSFIQYTYGGINTAQLTDEVTGQVTGGTTTILTKHTHYDYDSSNRLITVTVDLSPGDQTTTDGKVYVTNYSYIDTSQRINLITQTDGSRLEISYVGVGGDMRVASLIETAATGDVRTTSFSYDTANLTTTVSDPQGRITVLGYDGQGQLRNVTAPPLVAGGPGLVTQYDYDGSGNLTKVTAPSGEKVVYEYDSSGNRTKEVNDEGVTIVRRYGSDAPGTAGRNQLLSETRYVDSASGGSGASGPFTTRYVYDTNNNLRYVVTAEGEVTQHHYDSYGQRDWTLQYAVDTYDISGLTPLDNLSLSQLDGWVGATGRDKADAYRTDFAYDPKGALSKVTTYRRLNSDGTGNTAQDKSVTDYNYSPSGLLLSRTFSGANLSTSQEVYTYDGLNRVLTATDLGGFTTTTSYNDTSRVDTAVRANGLTTVSTYDRMGELLTIVSNGTGIGSATTTYKYDALGRLVAVIDPTSQPSYHLYDAMGRKVLDVAADGAVVEYRYDADSQLIATIRYATRLGSTKMSALAAAPAAANPVQYIPAQDAANDRWEWRIYDAAHRLVETIDAAGAATVYSYDGASRLVKTRAYAATLSTSAFKTTPPLALVIPNNADPAVDRVTRNFYDNDDRLVGTLDAEGFFTRNYFDAAGHKIRTVTYANKIADGTVRGQGSFSEVWNTLVKDGANDIYQYFLYDSRGYMNAAIDGEGNLTRYAYTALGHVYQEVRGQKLDPAALRSNPPTLWTLTTPPPSIALDAIVTGRDAFGRVIWVNKYLANGGLERTTNTYNLFGQLVSTKTWDELTPNVTSDVRVHNWRYDLRGNLIGELNGEGSAQLAQLGSNPTTAQLDAIYKNYGTVYAYDAAGRMVSKTTADGSGGAGNRTVYFYNFAGQLTFEMTLVPIVVTVGDHLEQQLQGELVEYRYDALGQRTDVITYANRVAGSWVTATLNGQVLDPTTAAGVLASIASGNDSRLQTAYNVTGTVSQTTDALGAVTTYGYDAFGDVTDEVDPIAGAAVTHTSRTYDRRGLLTSVTADAVASGLQAKTDYDYDAFGRRVRSIDPNRNSRYTSYDRSGRVVQTIDALGQITAYSYDDRGNIYSVTDRDGRVTTYSYDQLERNVTVTFGGVSVTTRRNAYGQSVLITDGEGRTTGYDYDRNGNVTKVTDGLAHHVDSAYDIAGRLVSVTDANGSVTAYNYDARNRVVTRTVDPGTGSHLNLTTTYAFNAKGQQITVTDPTGVVTKIDYDLNGRRIAVTADAAANGLQLKTSYTYDKAGRTLTVTEADGAGAQLKTQHQYDNLGRLVASTVNPSGLALTTTYTYDADGNMVAKTDPTGAITRYVYDAESRQIFSVDPAGSVARTYYDNEGRVTCTWAFSTPITPANMATLPLQATEAQINNRVTVDLGKDVSTNYVYDERGRLAFTIDAQSYVTGNQYDHADNLIRVTHYASPVSSTPLSGCSLSWLQSHIGSATDSVTRYVYDAANRLAYSIDALSVVTAYQRDAAGNVTRQTIYEKPLGYPEDPSYTGMQGFETAHVADSGNRVTLTAYDGAGRITSTTDARAGVTRYAYDGDGRVVVVTDPTNVATYHLYDAAGRKVLDIKADGSVTEFRYDAAGQLIASIRHAVRLGATKMSALAADPVHANPLQYLPTADDTNDRWEWRIYDNAHRLAETIDAAGSATIYTYDADGRLVKTREYSHTLAVSGFRTTPPTSLIEPAIDVAQDRVTRYFYDDDGRQIGLLDAEGFFTRNYFDAMDQKIRTVTYANKIADGTIRGQGAFDEIVGALVTDDSADIYQYFLYDTRGELRAVIDGEGDLTRYNYTPLGHLYQVVRGQKLVPATLRNNPPTLSSLPGLPPGATLDTTITARDAYGRVTSETKFLAAGGQQRTTYNYNQLGQLVSSKTWDELTPNVVSNVRAHNWRYDLAGNLIGELDGEGSAQLAQLSPTATTAQVDAIYKSYGTVYGYDADSRLISKTTADGTGGPGNKTVYFYNFAGQLTFSMSLVPIVVTVGDHLEQQIQGELVEYRYDALGQRTDVITYATRLGGSWVASINGQVMDPASAAATLASIASANDSRVQTAYNATGTVSQVTDAMGAITAYGYDAFGDLVSETDPISATTSLTTTHEYDRRGLVTKEVVDSAAGGLGLTTRYDYDAFGRRVRVTDPRSYSSLVAYDRAGRVIQTTDRKGYLSTFSYDERGNLLSATDRTGATTHYAYDQFERTVTVTTAENVVITTKRNAYGQTISVTDGENRTTSYEYDRDGNVTKVTDGNGDHVDSAYDKAGRLDHVTDASGTVTSYSYDARNRVVSRTVDAGGPAHLNLTTTYGFDAKGQQVKVTDPSGVVTTYAYDKAGRRTTVTVDPDHVNSVTTYEYDKAGRVLTVTQAPGTSDQQKTQYVYDAVGRLTQTILNPSGLALTTTYTYDANGNVASKTDASGATTLYVHDEENRLTHTVNAAGEVVITPYDQEGRLVTRWAYAARIPANILQAWRTQGSPLTKPQVNTLVHPTDPANQVTSYVYDKDGRLRFSVDAENFATEYRYDDAGNVLRTVAYATPITFNGNGYYLLADIQALVDTGNANNQVSRAVYDDANRLVYSIDQEGRVTGYAYDDAGRQVRQTRYAVLYAPATDPTYSNSTNPSAADMAAFVQAHHSPDDQINRTLYDTAGRVAYAVDADGFVTEYAYDAAGRVTTDRVYEDAYTVTSTTTTSDLRDLIAQNPSASSRTLYAYDTAGRLTDITDPQNVVTHMQLDAEGRATSIIVGYGDADASVTTRQYDAAGRMVSETRGSGTSAASTTTYGYDGLGRMTRTTDATGKANYVLYDDAGRKAMEVQPDGTVTEYRYDAVGDLIATIHRAHQLGSAKLDGLAGGNFNLSQYPVDPDPSDRWEFRIYDRDRRLVETIDAGGAATVYTYDNARLVKTRAYSGLIDTSSFRTSPPTVVVTPQQMVGPDGQTIPDRVTRYFYDESGALLGTLDAEGFLTRHFYNALGQKTRSIQYANQIGSSHLDQDFGDIVQFAVDHRDNTKDIANYFVYDGRGDLAGFVDGEGSVTRYQYSAEGFLAQEIHGLTSDPAVWRDTPPILATLPHTVVEGVYDITDYERDSQGRITLQTRSLAGGAKQITQNIYDHLGRLVTSKTYDQSAAGDNSDLRTQTWRYDAKGRLTGQLTGEGSFALASLPNGHTQADVDAVYAVYGTQYFYDSGDRLIQTVGPDGYNKTFYYYNDAGHLTHAITMVSVKIGDAVQLQGEVTEYRYDVFGERTEVVAYGTRLASGISGLTGGLLPGGLASSIQLLANTSLDSHTTLEYNATGTVKKSTVQLDGTATAVTTYAYDAFGDLMSQADPTTGSNTVTTTRSYDRRGMLTSVTADALTGGLQSTTSYQYDAFGRVVRTTDPSGSLRYTNYDRSGRVVQTIDALGQSTTYQYDNRGNLYSVTDRDQRTTSYAYDQFERKVTVTLPGNVTASTERNGYGQIVSLADGEGRTTTYAYDRDGHVTKVTDGLGHHVDSDYDEAGRLVSVTDANGSVTTYGYDIRNRVVTRTVDSGTGSHLNLTTTYGFDAKGQQITVTDPAGVMTKIDYDLNGRRMAVTVDAVSSGLQLKTSYTYDKSGRTLTVTQADGTNAQLKTQYQYDNLGRLVASTVNPSGLALTTTYAYDADGNMVAKTDPTNRITRYVYDAENRQVFSVDGMGSVVRTYYDNEGHVTCTWAFADQMDVDNLATLGLQLTFSQVDNRVDEDNAKDQVTSYAYDKKGRLGFVVDGMGYVTGYQYDDADNLIRTTQYAASVTSVPLTSYDYDSLASQVSAAGARVTRYVYDDANRQAYSIDAAGTVTANQRDANGNVIRQTVYAAAFQNPIDPQVAGMETFESNHATDVRNRVSRHVYDAANREAYSIDAEGDVTAYQRDNNGAVIRSTVYANAIATTGNPQLGAMQDFETSHADNADNRITRYVYDAAGRERYCIDAERGVTAFEYDDAGHVVLQRRFDEELVGGANRDMAAMHDFEVANSDSDDRVTRTFYDTAGRAVFSADAENYVTEVIYDNAGRVTAHIRYADRYLVNGVTTSQLRSAIDSGSTAGFARTTYGYDAAGRLTDSYQITGALDAEGHLVKIQTHLVLDAMGRTTDTIVAMGTADEATTHRNYDQAGRLKSETRAFGVAGEASITGYTYDAFGDVTDVTDGEGYTTHRTYDAMGRVLSVAKPISGSLSATTTNEYNAFGEVAKVTDPNLNVGYFYYDHLGRLTTQVDPEGYVTTTEYSIGGQVTAVTRYDDPVNTANLNTTTPPQPAETAAHATTHMFRDKLDRVTEIRDAQGYSETYELNAFGDRATVTNKLGGVTTNNFDKRGLLIDETLQMTSKSYHLDGSSAGYADHVVNHYEYDARGNRITMVEAQGLPEARTTTYTYDRADRLTGKSILVEKTTVSGGAIVTSADQVQSETITYDSRGNIVRTTDKGGTPTFYYYNDLNQRTAQVDALGGLTVWTYDKNGNVKTEKAYATPITVPQTGFPNPTPQVGDAFRETDYDYDRNNRLTNTTVISVTTGRYAGTMFQVEDDHDIVTTNVYDAAGNVVEQIDGNGKASFFYYDKLGRRIAQVDQARYLTTYVLDADGNVVTETRYSAILDKTNAELEALNRDQIANIEALAGRVNDANKRVTTFIYDKNGRRLSETRLAVSYVDVAGDGTLTSHTAAVAITYTYDGLGNVTSKTEATGDTTTYEYDKMGRLVDVIGPGFVDYNTKGVRQQTDYSYDGLNNLTRTVLHDANGAVSSQRITFYAYGQGGRLTSVKDASGFVRTFGYDLAGRTVAEKYTRKDSQNNAVDEAVVYAYDVLGHLTTQKTGWYDAIATVWKYGGSDVTQLKYNTYGEVVGRGINVQGDAYQETFDYDNAGRVWRSTAGDGARKYFVYDENGNLTLQVSSAGNALGAYTTTKLAIQALVRSSLDGSGAKDGSAKLSNTVTTIQLYDERSQQVRTLETNRDVGSGTQDINHSRTYNAFGEVETESDGRQYVTTYHYNTLGKLVLTEKPQVRVMDEHGNANNTFTPTEQNYYDKSGRLVGTLDANGNLSTRRLLSGTGYGDDQALSVREYFAVGTSDQNATVKDYDLFHDLRAVTDAASHVETYTYDGMDRLLTLTRPQRAGASSALVETYTYDGLGQRLTHSNNFLKDENNHTVYETTDYDRQGRVTRTVDFAGVAVNTSYTYQSGLVTDGMTTTAFGGWNKKVSGPGGTIEEDIDYFGRTITHSDRGGNDYSYHFDAAGRVTLQTSDTGAHIAYTYYNTGRLASIIDTSKIWGSSTAADLVQSFYQYDAEGNRTYEKIDHDSDHNGNRDRLEEFTATYDSLNRIHTLIDAGATNANITYEYDGAGNVRRVRTAYDPVGTATSGVQDYWYTYDHMNRVLISKGEKDSNNNIVVSTNGVSVLLNYDAVGHRTSALSYTMDGTHKLSHSEFYNYTEDGYLLNVQANDQYWDSVDGVVLPTGLHNRAVDVRDKMGRLTAHSEYQYDPSSNNNQLIYARTGVTYDLESRAKTDHVYQVQSDGSTFESNSTYTYGGSGVLTRIDSANKVTANDEDHTVTNTQATTTYGYLWWDQAQQQNVNYQSDTGKDWNNTNFTYDANGHVRTSVVGGGKTTTYLTDSVGQVMSRKESNGPGNNQQELYFYFDGVRIGEVGDEGEMDLSYAEAIAQRTAPPPAGYQSNPFADFDQSYDPINPTSGLEASTAGGYVVHDGDTLQTIAAQLWGDSSLWYVLADANGLDGAATLAAGQVLTVPPKVTSLHNTSETFKVYDPNKALGDVDPTQVRPAPPPKHHGCGILGRVLLAVVVMVVAKVLLGPISDVVDPAVHAILGAGVVADTVAATTSFALAAAGANAVQQGISIAAGVQDHFSWKSVGSAALTAALTGGGPTSAPTDFKSFLGDVITGSINNAITQGVGVALGLQDRFDWTGVAAAGISGAVLHTVGGALNGMQHPLPGGANTFLAGSAALLANAATRTLIDGSDFGDNIMAGLPDVVAQTLGQIVSDRENAQAQAEARTRAFISDMDERLASSQSWLDGLGDGGGFSPPRVALNGVEDEADTSDVRLTLNGVEDANAGGYSSISAVPASSTDAGNLNWLATDVGAGFDGEFTLARHAGGISGIDLLSALGGVIRSTVGALFGGGAGGAPTDGAEMSPDDPASYLPYNSSRVVESAKGQSMQEAAYGLGDASYGNWLQSNDGPDSSLAWLSGGPLSFLDQVSGVDGGQTLEGIDWLDALSGGGGVPIPRVAVSGLEEGNDFLGSQIKIDLTQGLGDVDSSDSGASAESVTNPTKHGRPGYELGPVELVLGNKDLGPSGSPDAGLSGVGAAEIHPQNGIITIDSTNPKARVSGYYIKSSLDQDLWVTIYDGNTTKEVNISGVGNAQWEHPESSTFGQPQTIADGITINYGVAAEEPGYIREHPTSAMYKNKDDRVTEFFKGEVERAYEDVGKLVDLGIQLQGAADFAAHHPVKAAEIVGAEVIYLNTPIGQHELAAKIGEGVVKTAVHTWQGFQQARREGNVSHWLGYHAIDGVNAAAGGDGAVSLFELAAPRAALTGAKAAEALVDGAHAGRPMEVLGAATRDLVPRVPNVGAGVGRLEEVAEVAVREPVPRAAFSVVERIEVIAADANVAAAQVRTVEGAAAIRATGGMRRPASLLLDDTQIETLTREFSEVGGDPAILRFNEGPQTSYSDPLDVIRVRGDVLPLEGPGITHPRSMMSSRAVLAHELGHRAYRGTPVRPGAWNDEFRASYWAAKNAPGLSEMERVDLLNDAVARAREAGVPITMNKFMMELLYGYAE